MTLTGYRFTTANDTKSFPGRNPISWSLSGSNVKSQTPGDTSWTLLDQHVKDYSLQAVNFMPFDFWFDYPQPVVLAGDVNGDGQVDSNDYECLRRHIVGLTDTSFVEQAADLNDDGKVNAQDLMLLLKAL